MAIRTFALLVAMGCSVGWQPHNGIAGGYRRNVLGNPSKPGSFRFQLKVPPGARVEAHKHTVAVHVTVLSGALFIIVGEPFDTTRARKYPAGSSFVVPADAWHVEWWNEPTVLEGAGFGPMETIRR
jgi:quercetin dioxygenase-like cupin family protein